MSRVRNADDFLLLFRGIKERYESVFAPLVAKIKGTFAEDPGELPPAVDESLEAHVRAYVVNAMLAALNWGLDKSPERELPNLLPEAPVKGASGTRRFLDYLGIDDGGECALNPRVCCR